jgi:colanic acid biosynthesis glycosyl transferase WcaI
MAVCTPHQRAGMLSPGKTSGLRIFLHDYGTYPFTFELARYWAAQGHRVHLAHYSDVQEMRAPAYGARESGIEITRLQTTANKYDFLSKPFADRRYGKRIAQLLQAGTWDVVVSGNTPLNAQQEIARATRRSGAAFVYWMHDYISRGIQIAGAKKFPTAVATAASAWYRRLEHRLLQSASAVILASQQFRPIALKAGVSEHACFVIENWCPIRDITPVQQHNPWAREHGLCGERVLLYSGTLGLKHNPSCLVALARRLGHTKVVVVAQGPGADWLRIQAATENLRNLVVLPLQPYHRLPEVLASATLLIVISDDAAASFCFPSKTLTYLAAGRPILGIMPRHCFPASLVLSSNSGIVVPPGELDQSVDSIKTLLEDSSRLAQMSQAARSAALARCDMGTIGPAFNRVLAKCAKP